MITRFITEVSTRFNPFSMRSRAARLFLSSLPSDVRASGVQIHTTLLPRGSEEPSTLLVKFSASTLPFSTSLNRPFLLSLPLFDLTFARCGAR